MEREPLLGNRAGAAGGYEKPVSTLRYYWPCLSTGVSLNTLALCASVWLTKYILDDPTRATYFQTNWWIVWLVALLMIVGACHGFVAPARLRLRLNPRRGCRRAAHRAPRPQSRSRCTYSPRSS